jgi:hypothetical protein
MTDGGAHIIMETLVHSTMLELIGVQKEPGTDGHQIVVLPDPLDIGEGLCFTPDGKRQWNPNWWQKGSSTLNTLFLESVVDQRLLTSQKKMYACHLTHDRNHLQHTICR